MKKTVSGFAFLLVLSFVFVIHAQGPGMMEHDMMHSEGEDESASGNSIAGAEIFNTHCRVCHVNGGNLLNPAKPLKGSGKLSDFKTFLNFIRQPGMPDGSRGAMPSFSHSQISDSHAEELYNFITSEKWALSGACPKGQDCSRFTQSGKSHTGSLPGSTAGLEKDIRDLHLKVISQAPHGCL